MTTRRLSDDRAELSEQVEKWGSFIFANVLWSAFSIPIITLPAATAGLFAVMSKWARNERGELFAEFFSAMRRLWRKATALALLDLLVGGIVALNFLILPRMDMSDPLAFLARSVTLFVGIAALLVNLYAWSLLVLVDASLRDLLEASVRLVFAYPLWSVGVLAAATVPIAFSLLLPQGFFLIASVSVSVLMINLGTWRVIRRHLPQTALESM
jgi:uncharacterized membrane protein YesL